MVTYMSRICSDPPPSITNDRTPESSNNYVRLTISYVFAHFNDQTSYPNLSIEILADNDYYSQPSCSTYDERVKLPKFNKFNKPISEINKTGLGSSAALITALTAALFSVMAREDLSGSENRTHVHNLAQAAHCAAQGKVGSGFDIAAAVYGSCIYRRFNPNYFQHIMLDADVYPKEFRKRLKNYIWNEWKMEITPFELPAGLQIVMGDVTGGSETPSMVRSVLQWKDKNAETLKIWEELGAANRKFIDRFADIPITDKKEVVDAVIKRLDHDLPSASYNPYLRQTLKAVAESFQVRLPLAAFD
jgi:phosphomevalonate kinase